MHIVSGATGHVGTFVANALLERKESVTVILHHPEKAERWKQKGAQVAIADVLDTEKLQAIFENGKRLFLLNPPAAPNSDTVSKELETLAAILQALKSSNIEKVVGESTYGAQAGEGIGDLGVLYKMEQELKAASIPNSIIRAAYYMSNWDTSLATAVKDGKVHTMYPVDFKLPMVAPKDIGKIAARLMLAPINHTGLHYVEGPETYSATDVAAAFTVALGKPVQAVETPADQWERMLESNGFSKIAAASMIAMTNITLKGAYTKPNLPERGITTIQQYITTLVSKAAGKKVIS
ncbi:NmrA family NAD(P)-binding protein [Chitinophaga sp. RAB17]|uniref:NmrA family NAD(P)-binding protein n=1 Tax=Chitinophaga sp. RAB17 TaxID=3233049 RepID=UPI003F93DF80